MANINTAICAIAKDEGRYLAEWIAFHRAIGFGHIWLYDNDSTDDTAEVAAKWPDFVTLIHWPNKPGVKAQFAAYEHFWKEFGNTAEWIMWLDCDEFINLKRHDYIDAFLADAPGPAIGINWRMFGDSGHKGYSPENMIERFTKSSLDEFGPNRHIKTIAKSEVIVGPGIHSPPLREGVQLLSPSGQALKPFPAAVQSTVEHDIVSVNHYFSKSYEEWQLKRARGKADRSLEDPERYRSDGEFAVYNRNDMEEFSIQRFLPRLKAALVYNKLTNTCT